MAIKWRSKRLSELSEYDRLRLEAEGYHRRKVSFNFELPLSWFFYNDHEDFDDLLETYIENEWGVRGRTPLFYWEPIDGIKSQCFDSTFLHEFMQSRHGEHTNGYQDSEVFIIRFKVDAELNRFVFAKEMGQDVLDKEGL